jgi:phosphatidylglycerophosphate synthase
MMAGLTGRIISEGSGLKLANLVTLSRGMLIVPIVLLLLTSRTRAALTVYLLAAATDFVDGWIARWSGRASGFGAQLDAVVDNLFSLGILAFLLLYDPGLVTRQGLALTILFAGPLTYLAISWLLTGRMMMFHFWSAKAGALLLYLLWPLLYFTQYEDLLSMVAGVVGLSRLEQIIFILRRGTDLDAPNGFVRITGKPRSPSLG